MGIRPLGPHSADLEAAKARAEASAADLEGIRLSCQAQLALAYFQLRILDMQRQLLDATMAAYERSLRLTKNQYETGVVSRADVLQAETQLKTTKAQAIDIGVQRAQLEHAIAVLTGKTASSFSLPVKKLVMPLLISPLASHPTCSSAGPTSRQPNAGLRRRMRGSA